MNLNLRQGIKVILMIFLGILWGIFFAIFLDNFFGAMFMEKYFGRIFLEKSFGKNFYGEEFFGRNSLFMFLKLFEYERD